MMGLGYRRWLYLVSLTLVLVACQFPAPATPSPTSPLATVAPTMASTAVPPTGTPVTVTSPTPVEAPTVAPTNTLTLPPTTAPSATSVPTLATLAPTTGNANGAIQAIFDYWAAVNDRNYTKAYGYWANNGAASGQTPDQFADGFANTVQATVQFGAFVDSGSATASVTLPVTLTAVSNVPNDPAGAQIVQYYHGTYTLQRSGSGWRIASAHIVQVANPALPQADLSSPAAVLQSYFDAINSREYARAYTYWSNPAQSLGQTFAQFHQGFTTTKQVTFKLGQAQEGGAAGSIYADVRVLLSALQTDGSTRTYCGTYTLRRANVPPFEQFGWHIESAKIAQISNVQLDSPEAEALLAQGCP